MCTLEQLIIQSARNEGTDERGRNSFAVSIKLVHFPRVQTDVVVIHGELGERRRRKRGNGKK